MITNPSPLQKFNEITPKLIEILQTQTKSANHLRELMWSLFEGHLVDLSSMDYFDEYHKSIALAIIDLGFSMPDDAFKIIRLVLAQSHELSRRDDAALKYPRYPKS